MLRIFFASLFVAYSFASCAQVDSLQLDKMYKAAIDDASNPLPSKVDTNLFEISFENKGLTFATINGNHYVKCVSLINLKDSTRYPLDSMAVYNTSKWPVWITLAPQLKQTCSQPNFGKTYGFNTRINQLIGLPPSNNKYWTVEMWVRVEDLFRPCADAEITDNQCSIFIPEDITEEHLIWYNNIRANQYCLTDCTDGWPWTQLGYTYDWNPNNKSHIGLSEYVIKAHCDVYVIKRYKTTDYCGR